MSFMTMDRGLLLHTYMGIVLVAVSYSRERPRIDIWLHSPTPYIQLIGAKAVVAAVAVACSLLFTGSYHCRFSLYRWILGWLVNYG